MLSDNTEIGNFSHIPKEFGIMLGNLRKEKGMTQHELEESSGLSLRMISDMERGQLQPSLITLFKIARGLKTSPLVLIERLLKALDK